MSSESEFSRAVRRSKWMNRVFVLCLAGGGLGGCLYGEETLYDNRVSGTVPGMVDWIAYVLLGLGVGLALYFALLFLLGVLDQWRAEGADEARDPALTRNLRGLCRSAIVMLVGGISAFALVSLNTWWGVTLGVAAAFMSVVGLAFAYDNLQPAHRDARGART